MRLIFLFSLMLISFSSWSYSVATQQETLSNPALKRTLNVRIFYPSDSHRAARLQAASPVFSGFYAIEQAPPAAGQFPLIVLSHGSGGNNSSLAWLAVPLAAQGAIVIAAGYYIRAQPEINLGVDRLPLPLLRLPQAGHFDFLPQCQPAAQAILAEEGEAFICETSREKREEVHQQTITAVSAFIQRS